MNQCHSCRWWTPRVPRANASMAPCGHLSSYHYRTEFDRPACALFAPVVPSAAPSAVATCRSCGGTEYDGMICRKCGEAWRP